MRAWLLRIVRDAAVSLVRAASDEGLYVGDHAACRVVRAKLGYEAEEELPLP